MIETTMNHITSEYRKLTQKEYKSRHDWAGKIIHLELYKKLKIDHSAKWYMHKPKRVLENETHKILCDLETQTNRLIQGRRQDVVDKKKRINQIVDFAVLANPEWISRKTREEIST